MNSKYKLRKDKNGVLRAFPLPTEVELNKFYSDQYYQKNKGQYSDPYSDEEIEYLKFQDFLLDYVLKNKFCITGGDLLEFGCGEGYTLKYFYEKGWDVSGVDFSSHALETRNPSLINKIKFETGGLLDQGIFSEKKFDVIILKNVLEHVIDLESTLRVCYKNLKIGGCLYLSVPNDYSEVHMEYMEEYGLSSEECPWFLPPEHLSYFSKESLNGLVSSFNFELIDTLSDFPIDVFILNKKLNYYKNDIGKSAHNIRVKYTNILSKNIDAAYQVSSAHAQLGLGRSIYSIFKKIE